MAAVGSAAATSRSHAAVELEERETRRRRKKVPPWLQLRVVVVPNRGFAVAVGGGAVNDQDTAAALFGHRISSRRKRCRCYRNSSLIYSWRAWEHEAKTAIIMRTN
ncbi:hypothetical protein PIB30_078964 [Stylosanthes scabra]|uniref:Uncharacterized protein n=1 Tax=Stylosanthes scabra TaxID=79078 RepID=A0ABU6QRG5_9FABA|nr:hypothetical protein [Stylosanthes scabra]